MVCVCQGVALLVVTDCATDLVLLRLPFVKVLAAVASSTVLCLPLLVLREVHRPSLAQGCAWYFMLIVIWMWLDLFWLCLLFPACPRLM